MARALGPFGLMVSSNKVPALGSPAHTLVGAWADLQSPSPQPPTTNLPGSAMQTTAVLPLRE